MSFADLKEQVCDGFCQMASYHVLNYDKHLTVEYMDQMKSLFDNISSNADKAIVLANNNKSEKDAIMSMLENMPRQIGGYNVPLSTNLMFRADGHGFSSLFKDFKQDNTQPFSLNITKAFIDTVLKFASTNEFKNQFCTYYLCSDEITGLSKGGQKHQEKNGTYVYNGSHPFAAKHDKVTSMISATLSSNFCPIMRQNIDQNLFDKINEKRGSQPTFDARVYPANNKVVGHMFMSRVLSCYRNTVSELHDFFFGVRAGNGKKSKEKKQRMMDSFGFDFDKMCPPCLKYGVFLKHGTVIIPTELPKLTPEFIDFLYQSKDMYQSQEGSDKLEEEKDDGCQLDLKKLVPFACTTFDDMLKEYKDGHYISEEIRQQKKDDYEKKKMQEEINKVTRAEKAKSFVVPSKEQQLLAKLAKKQAKQSKKEIALARVNTFVEIK
jgi:tRNA(His) 5'-end guanylyltransferase